MTPIYLPAQPVTRRRWPLVLLALGLALLSIFIFQRAEAQGPRLKPPFKLIRSEQQQRPQGPLAFPLGAPIILSQTFDSTYVPVIDPQALGWHQLIGEDAANITWKRVTTGPLPDTAWSAGQNLVGSDLDPATDTYTNNMKALLVYGPINLGDYYRLVLTTTMWADLRPDDYVGVAFSTDGSTFQEFYADSTADPALSLTRTLVVDVSPAAHQPVVWIGFSFTSNDDNINGRGAFVKDVVLRGLPYFKIFLPLTRLDPTPTPTPTNTPTPTPTPTSTPSISYRYLYTFGNGGSNNSDFQKWGGTRTTSCGSACNYYQEIDTRGNPGGNVKLFSYDTNLRGGSGPREDGTSLSTAKNFEYSSDFYVYTGQKDARYGLVFDASSGTFPGSGNPPFAPDYNYYTLELRMDAHESGQMAD